MSADTRRNLTALALVLGAVLTWSSIPVTLFATGLQGSLMYVALYRAGGAAGNLFTLALLFPSETRRRLRRGTRLPPGSRTTLAGALAASAAGKLEWLLYIHALQRASPHLVVLTYQVWPLLLIGPLMLLGRGSNRYARSGPLTIPAALACLAGVALTVTAGGSAGSQAPWSGIPWQGIAAALGAATMAGGQNTAITAWSDHAARADRDGPAAGQTRLRTFHATCMQAAAQLLLFPPLLAAALLLDQHTTPAESAAAIALGFLTAGLGDLLFRAGNAAAAHPTVPLAVYAEPVFSLLWLHLAFGLHVQNPAAVAAGAALTLAGNAAVATGGHLPRLPRRR